MSVVYRCDRCDREDKEPFLIASIPRVLAGNYTRRKDADNFNKDLCDNCVKELNEWVKPQAKQGKS